MQHHPATALTIGMKVIKTGPYLNSRRAVIDYKCSEKVAVAVIRCDISLEHKSSMHGERLAVPIIVQQCKVCIRQRLHLRNIIAFHIVETVVTARGKQQCCRNRQI